MLVVEAREIGRGRLLTVEPDVLDRGRAAQGAIVIHSICLSLRHCDQKSAAQFAKVGSGSTHVGVAHRSVFDSSDKFPAMRYEFRRTKSRGWGCLFGTRNEEESG